MDSNCNYLIRIEGQVQEDELNATSPRQVTIVEIGTSATQIAVCTDQSGLIGVLRHLHGQGIILLSVNCEH
jgi:hypothetical protein